MITLRPINQKVAMTKPALFNAPKENTSTNVGEIDVVSVKKKEFHQHLLPPKEVQKMHVIVTIAAGQLQHAIGVVRAADAVIAKQLDLDADKKVTRNWEALSLLLEQNNIRKFDTVFSFHTDKFGVKNAKRLPSKYDLETVQKELPEAEIKIFEAGNAPIQKSVVGQNVERMANTIEAQIANLLKKKTTFTENPQEENAAQ